VAETSLTVPGIKYVIDSGVARISRYSWRSKIQRLPIEKVSQASANQRKGRCGRMSEGVCIRLYEEEDFDLRSEFTEPEIQRTNLASVILQMENQKLGHIDDFPFVEPPEDRLINDGYKLLFELGAIDKTNTITKIGKQLAHFPIDPKLARILLQAVKENSLTEVLIIVSALATQDPRERPLDKQQAADEKHRAFVDKTSDFIFYINLWMAYHQEKKTLSGNQLRKWCKQNFISWMRMREWLDTHNQIKRMLSGLKISHVQNGTANFDQIHQALLIGFLANIGFKDEGKDYLGARNKRFSIFPGSALFKSSPQWIVAAEIVETSRVFARTNAKIDVRWIEERASHLLKYHYNNPHWEKKQSNVIAHQQSSLYGLIIHADKKISYGQINPTEAKEIFIRSALVEGDFESKAAFYLHNKKLLSELETLEAKSRRRDIIVDDNVLYDFYNKNLPDNVFSGATLDKWIRHNADEAKVLFLSTGDLVRDDATIVSDDQFPDHLEMQGSKFPVEYHFDPRNHCDGITLVTPVAGLNAINAQRCEWLIPGILHEKITALIRSLPKQLRKNFVPVPDFTDACIEALPPSDVALCTAVAIHLKKMTGVKIPYDAWLSKELSQHLFMNFRIIDSYGNVIEEGRNLQAIKDKLSGIERESSTLIADNANQDTQYEYSEKYRQDNVGAEVLSLLDDTVEIKMQGVIIKAYPALVVEGKKVNLMVLENQNHAKEKTHRALRQLYINALPEQFKYLKQSIPDIQNLCLRYTDIGCCEDFKRDILNNVFDDVFLIEEIKSESDFNKILESGKGELHDCLKQWGQLLSTILDEYRAVKKLLKNPSLTQLDTVTDIQQQINNLFPKDFISLIDKQWLRQYPRYISAINKRFEKSKSVKTGLYEAVGRVH